MKQIGRYLIIILVVMGLVGGISGYAQGAVTAKTLQTTFTLANMGTLDAGVTISYLTDAGAPWAADAANTSFTLAANGGQKQIRNYFDTTMTAGKGSAVITSSQPLAAITLLIARSYPTATSGGYEGLGVGGFQNYVPLVMKNRTTGNGLANSQFVVQNLDNSPLFVKVEFVPATGSGFSPATKTFATSIATGVSQYYDLDGESLLPNGWFGSAKITAATGAQVAGKVGVVSNLFIGPDLLYTINGFPETSVRVKWHVPYFTSKLANGQNTSVSVQNLSGGSMAVGTLKLDCTADSISAVATPIHLLNTDLIPSNATYEFNSASLSPTDAPAGWHGSCVVSSTTGDKNLAVAVFVRHINNATNGGGAGFMGIPDPVGAEIDKYKTVTLPYLNKRLANGVATVISVENLGATEATVTLTYKASQEFVGDPQSLVVPNVKIQPGEALVRNYRLTGVDPVTEPGLPDTWFGSLTITSNQPIQAYTFVTNYLNALGDTYFGFNGFPLP
jgi:hypothetical protein